MRFLEVGFALALVAAALLPNGGRRASILAAVAAGLGLAGLNAGTAPLPSSFLAADGGLFVLAVLLALGAALAGHEHHEVTVRVGAAASVASAVGTGWGASRVLETAPISGIVVALVVAAIAGFACLLIGRTARIRPPEDWTLPPRAGWARAGLLAGAAAAAGGPHLSLVILGTILATWSGWLFLPPGSRRVPVAPFLVLLLLPAWWLMATIAGPEGLGTGALPELPISPAAERLLAPVLLLAAWATAGLWPLNRQGPAVLVAPVGALLVARVVVPAMPEGLEHWRALVLPLVVAGLWHAALSRRHAGVAIGLAWVGLLAGSREGLIGAGLLLAAAFVHSLAAAPARLAELRLRRARPALRVIVGLGAGVGALLAVESGLRTEVVYTVAAVAGIVAAVGRSSERNPDTGVTDPRSP